MRLPWNERRAFLVGIETEPHGYHAVVIGAYGDERSPAGEF